MKNLIIAPAPYLLYFPDFGPLGFDPTTLPVPMYDATDCMVDSPFFTNGGDSTPFLTLVVDYTDSRSTRYQYTVEHGATPNPQRYELLVSEYEGCEQHVLYYGADLTDLRLAFDQLTNPKLLPYRYTVDPYYATAAAYALTFWLSQFCLYVPGLHPDDIDQIGSTGCIGADGQLWCPFTEQEGQQVAANMAQVFAVLGEDAAYDIMGYFLGNPDGSEDGGPAYEPSQDVQSIKEEYFPANA